MKFLLVAFSLLVLTSGHNQNLLLKTSYLSCPNVPTELLSSSTDFLVGLADGVNFFNYVKKQELELCFSYSEDLKTALEILFRDIANIKNKEDLIENIEYILKDVQVVLGLFSQQLSKFCETTFQQTKMFLAKIDEITEDLDYWTGVAIRSVSNSLNIYNTIVEVIEDVRKIKYLEAGQATGREIKDVFLPDL